MKPLSVHTSFSNLSDANNISRNIVREKLAACANLLPAHSIYWWEGEIESTDEVIVHFKTTEDKYPALEHRLRELHPYQTPMIVAMAIQAGSDGYLAWLQDCVTKEE
jgi:periplasmic divalent cation tolerance protein